MACDRSCICVLVEWLPVSGNVFCVLVESFLAGNGHVFVC